MPCHGLSRQRYHTNRFMLSSTDWIEHRNLCVTDFCTHVQSEPVRRLGDEINLRYGHYLFGKGEYDEGLAQMGMSSSSNPVMLLHLFPSLASPNLLQPVSHLLPGDLHLRHASSSTLPVTWFVRRCNPFCIMVLQYGFCKMVSAAASYLVCSAS